MKNIKRSVVLLIIISIIATFLSCAAKNSIGTGDLNNGAVTTEKIADGAVTGEKIAEGAISTENLASGVFTQSGVNFVSFDNVDLTSASPSASRSFQMTIPAYGYVVLSATGQITIMGSSNTFVQIGISDAPDSNDKTVQVGLGNANGAELYQEHSFGVSTVYPVSAGAYTFYCNMSIHNDKADTRFDQSTLYAIYVPTQY